MTRLLVRRQEANLEKMPERRRRPTRKRDVRVFDTFLDHAFYRSLDRAIGELGTGAYEELIPRSPANDIDAIMQLEAGFEKESLRRVMGSFRRCLQLPVCWRR